MSDSVDTVERTAISLSANAAKRIAWMIAQETQDGLMLRVAVSGGGCSGFQYGFSFDDTVNPDAPSGASHESACRYRYQWLLRVSPSLAPDAAPVRCPNRTRPPRLAQHTDSDTATGTITDNDSTSVDEFATSEANEQGTVSGTFADTFASDNVYEVITEELYNGNKRSRLEHEWTFNVTAGSDVTFYVEAYHNSAVEDFVFEYSTDTGQTGATDGTSPICWWRCHSAG